MKLLKLTLNNFQGLRSFELDIDGQDASVFGDNATGKTTLYNASVRQGKPTLKQKEFMMAVQQQKFAVTVCRSWIEVKDKIMNYL